MTGRRVDADEAIRMGLVSRAWHRTTNCDAAALGAVSDLLRAAPNTRSRVKSLINSRYGVVDDIGFEMSLSSDEVIEGFGAFTEKRSPSWVPEEFRSEGRL